MSSLDQAWGKRDENSGTWLSVADHSADVAAVTGELLRETLLGRRLAHMGGMARLEEIHIERLCFLAALHDFGKLCHGFQRLIKGEQGQHSGHVKPSVDLFFPRSRRLGLQENRRCRQLILQDGVETWAAEETLECLFTTTFCHHGRPHGESQPITKDWRPLGGYDPLEALDELVTRARTWFPGAFEAHGSLLPSATEFQHAWNGIITLADWLGSSLELFPYPLEGERFETAKKQAPKAVRAVGLNTSKPRQALGPQAVDFGSISPYSPRAAQTCLGSLTSEARNARSSGTLAVLEASTGSGKTEAALWHFARLYQAGEVDGLYFALPTRTAATQIYTRLCDIIERLFEDKSDSAAPPVTLAVPGYLNVDGQTGTKLERFEVLWDDPRTAFRHRAWAGESSKRYLAGAVVVGTIDQVLLSALQISHSHLRASCLLRHLLIVDEVHASDAYMSRILEEVLAFHRRAGGHALLMSATLGAAARERFFDPTQEPMPLHQALEVPYPAISFQDFAAENSSPELHAVKLSKKEQEDAAKEVTVDLRAVADQPEAIARLALVHAARGARVLIVRNTVRDCLSLQEALEKAAEAGSQQDLLFGVTPQERTDSLPTPHHGRYAPEDRKLLDIAIQEAFSPQRKNLPGLVAVATQTVEQSLDIDADLLLTDLCPMDVLLQRIGRLHRHKSVKRPHGYDAAQVIVLLPPERDLLPLLKDDGQARGIHGLGGKVYADLSIIEATWIQLELNPQFTVPEGCRRLVENSTHPEVVSNLSKELAPQWHKHMIRILGKEIANRQQAKTCLVDRAKPFGEELFINEDQNIKTRLGDDDLIIQLPGSPTSAFGNAVERIGLRLYEVSEIPAIGSDLLATAVEPLPGGGFSFQFESSTFRYDRLGIGKQNSS